ncbi:ribosomal L1 domain-containing protein 1 [Pseudochaenichthys georgianus]|uniref:ribosomal L1 domain-containing protein 1 n=1 Tax=Pseudochaenichthys georgianus TaxID=52239 RepID=UPI00146C3874|nr:ribosomal L1 domain-containing protein 1 [Pseudochaenichthys georgianus]
MRVEFTREADSMAETAEVGIDRTQVKKAVQALQAFLKTKSTGDSLFLDDTQQISLLFTLWKIPPKAQTIRIPLPHGQRSDTEEVCLFTRDEPNMTSDQTIRFYKKLLAEKGVKNITEVIPYKVLRTEYKPHEAKRRLLSNFDMFLSDDRVRRLLPSHLGKHFYQRKREPLCVNMLSKNLARDISRVVQGSYLKVTNKGSCCMARIAHAGMTADEVTENVEAAFQTVSTKLRTKGPVIKLVHIKTQMSVALPLYTSNLNHLTALDEDQKLTEAAKQEAAAKKLAKKNKKTEDVKKSEGTGEEIPQLVPMGTPSKKPKLEKTPKKKQLEKAPTTAGGKKGRKPQNKMNKKGGKGESKGKRRVPKLK